VVNHGIIIIHRPRYATPLRFKPYVDWNSIRANSTLLQTSTVGTWVISIIVTSEIWPVAIVIVVMGVVDVSSSQYSSNGHCWCHHIYFYCDMLTLMLKWMPKSHSSSILDVVYMHREIMTVSPRINTLVSCPVHRRACSAGPTHRDLGPSPEFGPPPLLSASRVGKPCLVEFFSNSSRPHPLISFLEL
jgi:hypothetical protein